MPDALTALTDYAQLLLGLKVTEIAVCKEDFHLFVRDNFCKLVAENYLQDSFWNFIDAVQDKTIYEFSDPFQINLLLLRLPESFVILGPFMQNTADEALCEEVRRSSGIADLPYEILNFYYALPVCTLPLVISTAQLFLSHVYQTPINAAVRKLLPFTKANPVHTHLSAAEHHDFKQLSQRYALENTMLSEVAAGNAVGAVKVLKRFLTMVNHITYISDPIANQKKLNTICNTLLRKTAEHTNLDLILINQISAKFSYQTENTNTVDGLRVLQYDMVSAYCELVKNNSLRNYSPIVRKALCYISENLGEQIQLADIADACEVSPNYLSALFNAETGDSIAAYINRKRVDKIADLLQNTNESMGNIAAYAGFADLNYCIKVFKKIKGMPPGAFRRKTTIEGATHEKN
ncbi:MAG: AraC family transcriptional regulator [Ruthenibacterium sp.]